MEANTLVFLSLMLFVYLLVGWFMWFCLFTCLLVGLFLVCLLSLGVCFCFFVFVFVCLFVCLFVYWGGGGGIKLTHNLKSTLPSPRLERLFYLV